MDQEEAINNDNERNEINPTTTKRPRLDTETESALDSNSNIPSVTFADIVGHATVKLRMEELLLPLCLPTDVVERTFVGIRQIPASILLYGPPGCGKVNVRVLWLLWWLCPVVVVELHLSLRPAYHTLSLTHITTTTQTQLARALAGQAQASFFNVAPSDILSKFVGESEQSMQLLFQRAAAQTRSVVFLDELDALGQSRGGTANEDGCARRVLAELLLVFNQLPRHVLVVGATNRLDDCDAALVRRFGIRVYCGVPTRRERQQLLLQHLRTVSHDLSTSDIQLIATATDAWSGSDLQNMCREACMAPIRDCIRQVVQGEKQKNDNANHQDDDDDDATTRMLQGMNNLRPVHLQDFSRALDFFANGQHPDKYREGYDSDEDEEDEGDETKVG